MEGTMEATKGNNTDLGLWLKEMLENSERQTKTLESISNRLDVLDTRMGEIYRELDSISRHTDNMNQTANWIQEQWARTT